MNRSRVEKILGRYAGIEINEQKLHCLSPYISGDPTGVRIDGVFDTEDLEAIVYWLNHPSEFGKKEVKMKFKIQEFPRLTQEEETEVHFSIDVVNYSTGPVLVLRAGGAKDVIGETILTIQGDGRLYRTSGSMNRVKGLSFDNTGRIWIGTP